MTQQNKTFRDVGTQGGAYDPQIQMRVRLLYNAPSRQVSSSYV